MQEQVPTKKQEGPSAAAESLKELLKSLRSMELDVSDPKQVFEETAPEEESLTTEVDIGKQVSRIPEEDILKSEAFQNLLQSAQQLHKALRSLRRIQPGAQNVHSATQKSAIAYPAGPDEQTLFAIASDSS